ncbi:MAG: hypothetical protein JXL97_07490 [Bacteroidales bacterium]|nr:hypothetical protein [Bacteroidales bacterium]
MKKTIFTLAIVFLSLSNFAQSTTWFSISARGGFGTAMFINVPSLEDSNIDYGYFSPSYNYGGRFGFMFGDYVGVSGIVGMSTLSQNYDIHGTSEIHRLLKTNTFDYGVLINLETPTGFYFEIGPKFSNLNSANLTTTGDNLNSTVDIKSKFSPEFTNLMFGIGMKVMMTKLFEIKVGLSGAYNFGGIVSESGYIIPAADKVIYTPTYIDQKTNPAQLMFSVEFTYIFGRFGKASCGKYRFLLNN